MSKCIDFKGCKFLDKIRTITPDSVNLYVRLYCENNVEDCARYMVSQALGSDAVPDDLFPHHRAIAEALISRLSTSQTYH
jgi:hypothetical protein